MKYSLAALLMLSTVALAQTAPVPGPAPLPEVTLKVTADEVNLISEGLQTQPFGKVVVLMNKLRQQIIDQQPKPDTKPEEPKK